MGFLRLTRTRDELWQIAAFKPGLIKVVQSFCPRLGITNHIREMSQNVLV